jgi:hypothetical protein
MEKEYISLLMEIDMMVVGKMTNLMDTENLFFDLERLQKEIGRVHN